MPNNRFLAEKCPDGHCFRGTPASSTIHKEQQGQPNSLQWPQWDNAGKRIGLKSCQRDDSSRL
ncbi:hypothetical protein PanWU01x14_112740 [Parasponia andersonii]|uniref:Uncharacterized protein n=1 Tax=Parasponia andersonii TaxID=3476 RepID=A0A2P5CYF1_PARAD|nr:hypothetical protein PanWU01x14_112740 [Parasponia andersonii]